MKVVVTGARGMLGEDIIEVLQKRHDVIPTDLIMDGTAALDVTNPEKVLNFFKNVKPDVVVHTVGWRDVDACEENQEKALLINTFGTKNVALACKINDCIMVHTSTDSLYRGLAKKSVTEYEPLEPVNFYGYSKLKAEEEVKTLASRYFILRLPILFGQGGERKTTLSIELPPLYGMVRWFKRL